MKTFVIDSDNNVTVLATVAEARTFAPDADRFNSEEALATIAAKWPSSRLIEIWNSIPGLAPVKKFTDRKSGVHRIWTAVQQLQPAPAATGEAEQDKPAKVAPSTPGAAEAKGESKKDIILGLLKRTEGATLADLMSASGWQAHSVRGFISGTLIKKLNLKVKSEKRDGHRVYSVAG